VIKNARSPILFGTFVIFFFVLVGVVWSATAPLDSAAVAIGTVISKSQLKQINHQEGGVLEKFYVEVGDRVEKGDKLLEFDDTKMHSEYEIILNKYRIYLAIETRLTAEINDDPEITYPKFLLDDQSVPEVAKIIETQNSMFYSKHEITVAEKASIEQKVKQTNLQIDAQNARKVALNKTREIVQDRLEASKKLSKKGIIKKTDLLNLEEKEAGTLGELAIADIEIAKMHQEIIKSNIELINLDNQVSTRAHQELKEVQLSLAEAKERLVLLKDALSRVIVRSPVDGVVNNLYHHTVRSVIQQGQPIVDISPTADSLVIEVKLEPRLISDIKVGRLAKIRFSAFKSRTTPLFMGEVVSMSPDIVIDPRQQNNPTLANGYYLARIEIDMDAFEEIAKTRNLELLPGMQAEVQIITGTRTMLQYLLDPVFDAMFKGFKEK